MTVVVGHSGPGIDAEFNLQVLRQRRDQLHGKLPVERLHRALEGDGGIRGGLRSPDIDRIVDRRRAVVVVLGLAARGGRRNGKQRQKDMFHGFHGRGFLLVCRIQQVDRRTQLRIVARL